MQWIQAFSIYADRRVFAVFLLGISSGFPWVLISTCLTVWLKESGISRAEIGYAGIISGVYAINFLWAPLVDRRGIFPFTALGKRRSWILCCQLFMALACIAMSFWSPDTHLKPLIFTGLAIAIFAATHDIAIDAFRIDSFSQNEKEHISAAAAAATSGWWTGYSLLGMLPLLLSDLGWTWPELYRLLSTFIIVLAIITTLVQSPLYAVDSDVKSRIHDYFKLVASLPSVKKMRAFLWMCSPLLALLWLLLGSPGIGEHIAHHSAYIPASIVVMISLCVAAGAKVSATIPAAEPGSPLTTTATQVESGLGNRAIDKSLSWFTATVLDPLRDFFLRNGKSLALALIAFIFMFKIGEAMLGKMSIVFYKEVGFSNTEIGIVSKPLNFVLTVVFSVIGGVVNARLGIVKGLFISGIAMALANLMFAWLHLSGPVMWIYISAIVVDGFTTAWSLVAFVAFVSALCDHRFSATQYALLASLGNFGRTTLSGVSGQIVDWLDGNWTIFFLFTAVAVLPSLLLLLKISKQASDATGLHEKTK